jgi:dephospho-CoA kinase
MIAIGVAGGVAAGKSRLIRRIADAVPIEIISFGRYVRAEAEARGLGVERKVLQDFGAELVATLGADPFLESVLLEQMSGETASIVVFDGIRHVEIWEAVRRRFGRATLVYLSQDKSLRLERLMAREGLSRDTAVLALEHAMEVELTAVEAAADVVLRGDQGADFIEELLSAPRGPLQGA